MLPAEDVLLGRLEENSDPSHPSFIPNIEDFFLTRVDKTPIEKYNILSSFLSKQIEKKLKDDSKAYRKAQRKYLKYEEKLMIGQETRDTSPATEFANVSSSVAKAKEESSKRKKMD